MTKQEYLILSKALEEIKETIVRRLNELDKASRRLLTIEEVENEAKQITQHND